jgi:hypothetical protein
MKIKIIYIIVIMLIVTILSCNNNIKKEDDNSIIAKIGENYLYYNQIFIPNNITDTAEFIKNETNKWIKNQLLYIEAVKYLPKEEKEAIEPLINDYKQQLYINSYIDLYVKTKLDTIVTNNEVFEYYNKNKIFYKLPENIVKAIFIKIPANAPKINKIENLLKSKKEKDVEKLNIYCAKYAEKFDDFKGNWVEFSEVLKLIPNQIENSTSTLKNKHILTSKDSLYYYFIDIYDYKLEKDTTPLIFVKNEIIEQISKKKKKDIIKKLEYDLMKDNENKKTIEILNK